MQRSLHVTLRLLVTLQAVLRPAQEAQRADSRCPVRVRLGLQRGHRPRCKLLRRCYVAQAVVRQRQQPVRARQERWRGDFVALWRLLRPVAHAVPVGAEEAPFGDRQLELHGGRRAIVQSGESRQQKALSFVVFAEQVLDRCSFPHRVAAQRRVARKQRQQLAEGVTALFEVARRPQRHGHGKHQLHPARRLGRVGQQSQGSAKPSCCGRRSAGRSSLARLDEHRDRLGIAKPCRALYMTRARRRRRAPRAQNRGRARVRGAIRPWSTRRWPGARPGGES